MTPEAGSTPRNTQAIVVALILFALAAGLLWGSPAYVSPVPPAVHIPAWVIDASPVREALLSPNIMIAGYSFRCGECHNLFPSAPTATQSSLRHNHIQLKHGINTHCFNCHHLTNRDAFTDDIGETIAFDTPQLLCARCHGPVYRDWQHGVHGRSNGYWDESRGELSRLKCIQCHDPHQPPFPPMAPAPPPNTLRMGVPAEGGHPAMRNPLRVHTQDATAAPIHATQPIIRQPAEGHP